MYQQWEPFATRALPLPLSYDENVARECSTGAFCKLLVNSTATRGRTPTAELHSTDAKKWQLGIINLLQFIQTLSELWMK